ncbi:hypothetical protein HZS_3641 [Henneguya salminicola]|nr:hypothetical protein HZS_3641 [Henneguya salminicola]
MNPKVNDNKDIEMDCDFILEDIDDRISESWTNISVEKDVLQIIKSFEKVEKYQSIKNSILEWFGEFRLKIEEIFNKYFRC